MGGWVLEGPASLPWPCLRPSRGGLGAGGALTCLGPGEGDVVVGLGVHKHKRQLHGDIPVVRGGGSMKGQHPRAGGEPPPPAPPKHSPATRHHELHLDPVGHQDAQHLLVGALLHAAMRGRS